MEFDTISITGTPGTGKTSAAEIIGRKTDYRVLDVNKVAKSEDVDYTEDQERKTMAVDVGSLKRALEEKVSGRTVLEGHLSHHYDSDMVVVLRAHPEELEKRLENKEWGKKKIEENVESEAMDIILQESVHIHDENVYEIDTTDKSIEQVAEEIISLMEDEESREKHRPGTIDWSEDYW